VKNIVYIFNYWHQLCMPHISVLLRLAHECMTYFQDTLQQCNRISQRS